MPVDPPTGRSGVPLTILAILDLHLTDVEVLAWYMRDRQPMQSRIRQVLVNQGWSLDTSKKRWTHSDSLTGEVAVPEELAAKMTFMWLKRAMPTD